VTDKTPSPGGAAAARASLFVALSACGFGAIAIMVTFATAAGAPLLSVLMWRYGIATVLLAIAAWVAGMRRPAPSALRITILAGGVQTLVAVLSLSALRYVPAATLSFLFYTYPAWVAVIARVRHSEPLTPTRLAALVLALAGIFVMVGTSGDIQLQPIGIALALVSAMIYAAYVPMIGALQGKLDPAETSTYVSGGATVFLGILALTRGELVVQMHQTAWLATLGLAVLSTAGAFLLFLRGLRVLGAVRTAIISTIEPFITALLGAWLLAQPLTRTTLLGGALIAAAVVMLQLNNQRPVAGSG